MSATKVRVAAATALSAAAVSSLSSLKCFVSSALMLAKYLQVMVLSRCMHLDFVESGSGVITE